MTRNGQLVGNFESRLLNTQLSALGGWCRGTESSCRHQPFQGLERLRIEAKALKI
jgi:hypothetical protein